MPSPSWRSPRPGSSVRTPQSRSKKDWHSDPEVIALILDTLLGPVPLTELQMDVVISWLNLPTALLAEFHDWARRGELEPVVRLLMAISDAASDRRVERLLEIVALGRS